MYKSKMLHLHEMQDHMLRISWSNRIWPIGNKTLQSDPHVLRGVLINGNFYDILQKMMRAIWKNAPLSYSIVWSSNPIFLFFFFRFWIPKNYRLLTWSIVNGGVEEIRDTQDWIFQLFFSILYGRMIRIFYVVE